MIILGIFGGVFLIGLIAGVLLCIGASMVVCKCCGVTRTTVVRTGYLALSAAILSAVNSILFIVILANNTYTWGTGTGVVMLLFWICSVIVCTSSYKQCAQCARYMDSHQMNLPQRGMPAGAPVHRQQQQQQQ